MKRQFPMLVAIGLMALIQVYAAIPMPGWKLFQPMGVRCRVFMPGQPQADSSRPNYWTAAASGGQKYVFGYEDQPAASVIGSDFLNTAVDSIVQAKDGQVA